MPLAAQMEKRCTESFCTASGHPAAQGLALCKAIGSVGVQKEWINTLFLPGLCNAFHFDLGQTLY